MGQRRAHDGLRRRGGGWSRRRFLGTAAATGVAGLGLSRGASLAVGRGPWGEYPAEAAAFRLPESRRAKKVLEVFLFGGLSPWESFYTVVDPAYGADRGEMWFTWLDEEEGIRAWYERCYGGRGAGPLTEPFRVDSIGTMVHLGPLLEPLRRRADIVARLRIHVLAHDLFPHEPAVPLALTGSSGSAPRMAAIGTPVSRYFLERGGGANGTPLAYNLGYWFKNELPPGHAVGSHPSAARPFPIVTSDWLDARARLDALAKNVHGPEGRLMDALVAEQASRLQSPALGRRLRSPALAAMEQSVGRVRRLDTLMSLVDGVDLSAASGSTCDLAYSDDGSDVVLRLAAHLLQAPASDARHVLVIDGAYDQDAESNPPYDHHEDFVSGHTNMVPYFFERLGRIINEPGEKDPTKIDLDETLVVINTEFGRAPGIENYTGRNHYPLAYTTVMFGGPVGPDQQGIVGAIDANALPIDALTPAETRAATLVAMGIYPFSADSYAFGDLNGVADEVEGAQKLAEVVLGVRG